ncbi:Nif3-like dinuclear metal center hexameric protein [Planctomicrobium sp. SH527]|uniref:Nif3-like dinuclear metal center hexameric protein n=1 Tax=Planctomicrobium sp. SH527 TaxID=3448123 RepID=UPI003F5C22EC
MPESICSVLDYLATFAPASLAEDWDNVGLLLGERDQSVERVLTCLTLTPDVAEEAIAQQAQLIISHHPILFKPVQKLTSETSEGRMLLRLIRHGVAVFSPHTAFDSAKSGINQQLAESLGLVDIQPLRPQSAPELAGLGSGRWGRLANPVALGEFLSNVKLLLGISALPYVGDLQRPISSVGVACGAAGEFLSDAKRAGCDLFLTGETRFHTCLEARDQGIALVMVGHYASERPGVERLAETLQQQFPSLLVWASRVERDPVEWSLL